jgi:hypothetical protein
VVIWFPQATRECFLHGFRWGNGFIGLVMRGEEVDPIQEVYYERVRRLTELLEKEDTMVVSLPVAAVDSNKTPPRKARVSRQLEPVS